MGLGFVPVSLIGALAVVRALGTEEGDDLVEVRR